MNKQTIFFFSALFALSMQQSLYCAEGQPNLNKQQITVADDNDWEIIEETPIKFTSKKSSSRSCASWQFLSTKVQDIPSAEMTVPLHLQAQQVAVTVEPLVTPLLPILDFAMMCKYPAAYQVVSIAANTYKELKKAQSDQ